MRIDRRYLLRLWRDGQSEEAWRASLKDVSTGQETHFKSLDVLVKHLHNSLEAMPN